MAAAAIIVHGLAEGPHVMRQQLRVDPRTLVLAGLLLALLAGVLPLINGQEFLTGMWMFFGATVTDKGLAIGTPLLFDLGVYLVVVGGVAGMFIAMEEELYHGNINVRADRCADVSQCLANVKSQPG